MDDDQDEMTEVLHETSNPTLTHPLGALRPRERTLEQERGRPATGTDALALDTCLTRLRSRYVGRLAFLASGRPLIVPVNYLVDGEDIIIRTDPGSKLRAAARRQEVAFEVDQSDALYQDGWSVVVQGRAEEVVRADEIERLRSLTLVPWARGDRSHWIRIRPDVISGRRLSRPFPIY